MISSEAFLLFSFDGRSSSSSSSHTRLELFQLLNLASDPPITLSSLVLTHHMHAANCFSADKFSCRSLARTAPRQLSNIHDIFLIDILFIFESETNPNPNLGHRFSSDIQNIFYRHFIYFRLRNKTSKFGPSVLLPPSQTSGTYKPILNMFDSVG
jgi:hypothetical protein